MSACGGSGRRAAWSRRGWNPTPGAQRPYFFSSVFFSSVFGASLFGASLPLVLGLAAGDDPLVEPLVAEPVVEPVVEPLADPLVSLEPVVLPVAPVVPVAPVAPLADGELASLFESAPADDVVVLDASEPAAGAVAGDALPDVLPPLALLERAPSMPSACVVRSSRRPLPWRPCFFWKSRSAA